MKQYKKLINRYATLNMGMPFLVAFSILTTQQATMYDCFHV